MGPLDERKTMRVKQMIGCEWFSICLNSGLYTPRSGVGRCRCVECCYGLTAPYTA